ncbi:hypothetical protein [Amycolatopsis taiwanensis]|uniref:hypothetical protein n=1 Tax=Amycolatopsis taiwanensis TaxID=342230 RepID=UPI000483CB8D|nr:hypothetical protein [Amycolatopsis taiwanensis]
MNFLAQHPATLAIIIGEIAFWLFLLGGLIARYPMKMARTSVVLLTAVPLVDLAVLIASVIDLARGTPANFSHGLAAVYLGFSIVFGPSMIRWADGRFAHRFADGPKPRKPEGREKIRREWLDWGKCVASCAIAAVLLLAAIFIMGEPQQVAPLWEWMPRLGGITVAWLLLGPVWTETFRRKTRAPQP